MPLNTLMPSERRALAPGAGGEHQRKHAEDEGERGHQDRPEPNAGGLGRGIGDGHALEHPVFAGDLDDQDAVFRGQRDQQHQADLGIEVVGGAQAGQRDDRPEQGQRHGGQHRERQDPAFILPGEHEVDQQDRQAERVIELIAGDFLLIGHRRPFEC